MVCVFHWSLPSLGDLRGSGFALLRRVTNVVFFAHCLNKYIMAHEDIYEQFMAKIIERTKLIKRGNPLDTETMIGGNIEEVHTDYENGFYIPPTLLKDTNKMRIFQEEIFGPVIAVTTFKTEAEALELANDSEFGLPYGP